MRAVERHLGPFRDRLVFFPDAEELGSLARSIGLAEIVRVRQTEADIEGLPNVVATGVFRTACIDLTDDDDAIVAGMKKDTRREIRLAERLEGLEISHGTPADAADFLPLYNAFVRAKGHIDPMSPRRLRNYAAVADIWVARVDGSPLIVRMMLPDPAAGRVRFLYEGTARLDGSARARLSAPVGRWMHLQQMRTYRAAALRCYDLGGIGDGSGPVARFKLSLGGAPVQDRSCVIAGALIRPIARRAARA
jgi:hypothetical protein